MVSVPVAAGISASVLAVGLAGVSAIAVLVAGAQAANAADAAALAAADVEFSVTVSAEVEPCELAARVASANGAELVGCEPSDMPGEVRVRVVVRVGVMSVTGAARAGAPGVG